jgi:hypothetical protein
MTEKFQASKEKPQIQRAMLFGKLFKRFDKIHVLNEKFQAPKNKTQINPNDRNSKLQTSDQSADMPNRVIKGIPAFAAQMDATVVSVLVIEYWNLRFICNLVLEIWDFIDL